jgi:Ca2+-binding RTX toxin-like protein
MMDINLVPDSSVSSAPAGFTAAIQAAAQVYDQDFPGNYTVNITYGWGTYDDASDDSLTDPNSGAFSLGGIDDDSLVSYGTLKDWLTADASLSDQVAALASLPAASTAFPNSVDSFLVSSAQEKALGEYSGSSSAVDGSIGFNIGDASASSAEWEEGALCEIGHALGWLATDTAPDGTILDLYRYSSAGVYDWTAGDPAYFSIDGGKTDLANFATTFDPTLFENLGDNEPFTVPFTVTTSDPTLTSLDLEVLNVLGFGGTPAVALPDLAITSTDAGTDPRTQTISGTIDSADAGATVSIYDGSTLLGTTTPDGSGAWSMTVDLLSIQGPQSVEAQATNSKGTGTSNAVVYEVQPGTPPDYSDLTVTTGGGLTVGAGDGDVQLFDQSGGDTLTGGAGSEVLHSSGDNLLVAGSGPNTLFGGSGDDTLIGGANSKLIGGSGIESLSGADDATSSFHDTMIAGSGEDVLRVYLGSNKLDGAASGGAVTMWGGAGDDTLNASGSTTARMHAGSGAETLFGGYAAGTTDTMWAGSGQDLLKANAGQETLNGGTGEDTLRGGTGQDSMYGGMHSHIDAGSGDDNMYGSSIDGSTASMFGGVGHDYMQSQAGNDLLDASGGGDDTLAAGSGNDTVFSGNAGHSTIYGGTGDDTINLSAGAAVVFGGSSGADSIIAGAGDDTITGGEGTATVYTSEAESQITRSTLVTSGPNIDYTDILFQSGQVLILKGVTIDFAGGGSMHT